MKLVFFGDSITEGSNSKLRFTDFLDPCYEVYNFGVSGTTIGEYSIYPVDGNSLLSQIAKHQNEIKAADTIFIEYGSNDVASIMCGFATIQTVTVSFVKAVDWIKQLNEHATIIFLAPGDESTIHDRGYDMCEYLEKDYFSAFNFKFSLSIYVEMYKQIIRNISHICDIIYMFDDEMLGEKEYISDDNIHPNEKGHKRIAENILKQYQ